MRSLESERVRRERHIARLFEMLSEEITARAPRAIWEWPALGEVVDFADRRLQRVANRYEDGTAAKEEVLDAAEALRAAWRVAVERYSAEESGEGVARAS